MKKGTKSRNAGGRVQPLPNPEKEISQTPRPKPKMKNTIQEVFKIKENK